MVDDDLNILFLLNSLDNDRQELAESVSGVGKMYESTKTKLDDLMKSLSKIRMSFDKLTDRMRYLWDGLLIIADQAFSTPENCTEQTRNALKTVFNKLGYNVYGITGTNITDSSQYEIVYIEDAKDMDANMILQTIKIGLCDKNGEIARLAKVVVSKH